MFEFIDVFHMTSVATTKLLLNKFSRLTQKMSSFFFGHNYEQLPLLAEFQPRNVL